MINSEGGAVEFPRTGSAVLEHATIQITLNSADIRTVLR